MIGTAGYRGKIVDAIASVRDDALTALGRQAAVRQQPVKELSQRPSRTGGYVAAAVAAGAAIAAGAVVYRARKAKSSKEPRQEGGRPSGNGMVSEHEHDEDAMEATASSRRPKNGALHKEIKSDKLKGNKGTRGGHRSGR